MEGVQAFSYICGWCFALSIITYFSLPVCSFLFTRIIYLVAITSLAISSFTIPLLKDDATSLQEALTSEGVLSREKKQLVESLSIAQQHIGELEVENEYLRQVNSCSQQIIETSTIALQQLSLDWREEVDEGLCLGSEYDAQDCSEEYGIAPNEAKRDTRTEKLSDQVVADRLLDTISETSALMHCASIEQGQRASSTGARDEAAQIERIIRQRIIHKIDVALEVYRRQGKFRFDNELLSRERTTSATMAKDRIDSLMGLDNIMIESNANESRKIVPCMA